MAIRPPESKLTVGLAIELIALLMDGTMMPATQRGEIRERRWSALSPVTDVVALDESAVAPGKSTTAVPMMQCSPQRCRYRPSSCSDLRDAAVGIMPHDHARRVAGEPLGRFRGNACAAVDD